MNSEQTRKNQTLLAVHLNAINFQNGVSSATGELLKIKSWESAAALHCTDTPPNNNDPRMISISVCVINSHCEQPWLHEIAFLNQFSTLFAWELLLEKTRGELLLSTRLHLCLWPMCRFMLRIFRHKKLKIGPLNATRTCAKLQISNSSKKWRSKSALECSLNEKFFFMKFQLWQEKTKLSLAWNVWQSYHSLLNSVIDQLLCYLPAELAVCGLDEHENFRIDS